MCIIQCKVFLLIVKHQTEVLSIERSHWFVWSKCRHQQVMLLLLIDPLLMLLVTKLDDMIVMLIEVVEIERVVSVVQWCTTTSPPLIRALPMPTNLCTPFIQPIRRNDGGIIDIAKGTTKQSQ
jgi:hypothetical protein